MRSARVRPMVELDSLDSTGLLDRSDEDGFVEQNRHMRCRHDYLVRQAFLRSYQFSVKETFKEKIMRSIGEVNDVVKVVVVEKIKRTAKKVNELTKVIAVDVRNELNDIAKSILNEVRLEMSEGRIRNRVFWFRLPVAAMVRLQCFTPRGD
ncbi:hypothetical protein AAC387_Pa05g0584 [Persea americana]